MTWQYRRIKKSIRVRNKSGQQEWHPRYMCVDGLLDTAIKDNSMSFKPHLHDTMGKNRHVLCHHEYMTIAQSFSICLKIFRGSPRPLTTKNNSVL